MNTTIEPLTQEEKRIKIAESCGWHKSRMVPGWWGHQHHLTTERLPDYLNSLDAMHEAQKVLFERGKYNDFERALIEIMGNNFRSGDPFLWNATAEQLAESFGKTLNLW